MLVNMNRKYTYRASGACCTEIHLELAGDVIRSVAFKNGCHGNHQGIEALVRGRQVNEVISCLSGIKCRNGTSCPDQLAQALSEATASMGQKGAAPT